MAVNIEIKARVRDMDAIQTRAAALSDTPCRILVQEDVFFRIPQGRLKLRFLGGGDGQLIYYERNDETGPKPSHYSISHTAEPETLRTVLGEALGIRGEVRKVRRLYLVGQTRIHLDQVEGLGAYVELEVVLEPDQSHEDGRVMAMTVMENLGIEGGDLVTGAYIDLLESGDGGQDGRGTEDG